MNQMKLILSGGVVEWPTGGFMYWGWMKVCVTGERCWRGACALNPPYKDKVNVISFRLLVHTYIHITVYTFRSAYTHPKIYFLLCPFVLVLQGQRMQLSLNEEWEAFIAWKSEGCYVSFMHFLLQHVASIAYFFSPSFHTCRIVWAYALQIHIHTHFLVSCTGY